MLNEGKCYRQIFGTYTFQKLTPPPFSRELLIISDSQTAIQNITQPLYKRIIFPITIFIRNILQYFMHYQNSQPNFLWMPTYAGIPGNETADRLARTTNNTMQFFPFQTHNDILSQLRHNTILDSIPSKQHWQIVNIQTYSTHPSP